MEFISPQNIIAVLKTETFHNLATPIVELTTLVKQAFHTSASPPILYLSGGVDSQAMLETFARAGISSKVVTLSLESKGICFNDFDVTLSKKLAAKYGFPHDVRVIDPLEFFASGKYLELMSRYNLRTPGVALYAYLLESTPKDRYCFMAGQPPYPVFDSHNEANILIKGEDSFFHDRVLEINNLKGHGCFLCANPRVVASWLQLPYFQKTLHNLQPLEAEELFKRKLYLQAGFEPGFQTQSHHGLEKFIPYFRDKAGMSWSDL